jgi:hypothetical protein
MYVKDKVTWKTQVYKEDYNKTGLKFKSLWGEDWSHLSHGMNQRWVRVIWGCHKDVDEDPNLQDVTPVNMVEHPRRLISSGTLLQIQVPKW